MELKDLAGKHSLDAVDFSTESIKADYGDYYEDCDVMRFRLDGVVYTATEDPEDGYRSHMSELKAGGDEMKNVFPPIEVVARHREKGEWGDADDILELIDATTGKTVVEVGTESTDDYYPCFVASFKPDAMSTNG